MKLSKAIILALVLTIGATSAFAQLDGTWAGEGKGSCQTPWGSTIHPWQTWKGQVKDGTFWGSWIDSDGNQGTFKGAIIAISPETAFCKGIWTAIGPEQVQPVELGAFEMTFNYIKGVCKGRWWPYAAVTPDAGVMVGKKVE